MIDKLSSLVVIINFGSLVLLSFLKLTNPISANRSANKWFGVFLLLWSTFWTQEILMLAFGIELTLMQLYILESIQFFTPILFYYSILKYSDPGYKPGKKIVLHLILPAVYMIILYIHYYKRIDNGVINYLLLFLVLGQSSLYSLASFIRIRKHQKFVLAFSSDSKAVDLFWLERIIIAVLILIIISIIYNIIFLSEPLNLFMNLILLMVIFYVAFHSMGQKEIYPFSRAKREEIRTLIEEPEAAKSRTKIVSDEELVPSKIELDNFMSRQKPYTDPELNLVKLADMTGITPHRLSYIINAGSNMNFFNFVNNYRIEKAKVLLLEPEMRKYSIMGIAFECGFNSKTTFNNTFKKITGLTPTEFRNKSMTL